MGEIVDFTQKKIEREEEYENSLYYIIDPQNWNPLAFVANNQMYLSPYLGRILRHKTNEYDWIIENGEKTKIYLYSKESGYVWIWTASHRLDKEILEYSFGENIIDHIDEIYFNIYELGWSKKQFSSKEELLKLLHNAQSVRMNNDKNPK